MKELHFFKILVVLAAVLPGTGCKFMSAFNNHSSQHVVPGQITEMPSVTTTDLDATGRRLVAAGLTVLVKRPVLVINADKKYSTDTFKLPEIIQPFKPSRWNHMIAAQEPPTGASLRTGSVITLTAGIHHGAGPFQPWLDAHGGSVSSRGEQRCRDCHPPAYCSECHVKLNLPIKTQRE